MHVPDGFLDAPTSVATGVVAAAAVGIALRRAGRELDERTIPLAGLCSAFVFAGQMVNFPVGIGTSGHLMGGALAAVLVGPWTALLSVSVVLLVQALLFADGGVTALGSNVTLLGVTAVAVGWFVTRAVLRFLPRRPASVVPAAAVGAFLSVVGAALVFVALFAVGGSAPVPLPALTLGMVAVHALIGLGEAAITGLVLSAVVAVRPDLVRAAPDLRTPLRLGPPPTGAVGPVSAPVAPVRVRLRWLVIVGGLATVAVAVVGSQVASSSPDGLERVAGDMGFLATAQGHALGALALAEYGDVGGVPVWVAGLLGVLVTAAVGVLLLHLAGRRRATAGSPRDV